MLFEAYVMLMGAEMPMAALSRIVGEHDTRLWRVLEWHVADARSRVKMEEVEALVVDETSRAKGQTYVTIFAEPGRKKGRVLFVTEGRDHQTFRTMLRDFEAHGGVAAKVRDIAMDMSAAFMRGAAETLPFAAITFDRFHVVKLVSDALDQVRRAESSERPELKGTRFTWLRNLGDLSPQDCERAASLATTNLRTTKAWQLRLNLQPLWEQPDAATAETYLKNWCRWALRVTRPRKDGKSTGFEPMRRAVTTIREHAQGILHYFRRRMTTAVLEGINSIAQAARSRARGYRNPSTFMTMIYLLAGRLQFALPSLTHTG
jgi:transposase